MSRTVNKLDHRLMAACLRLARRHCGRTYTNPSVGTLIVMPGETPRIIGRGITAIGGRPHAEPIALLESGNAAKGATAYVTLEPCAHHGSTPPCAEALIAAGVSRVVTAWIDPDDRVDGKGHAMLRDAGIDVETGIGASEAGRDLGGYRCKKTCSRPHVFLKLAVSKDGMLGLKETGQVSITGAISRAQTHMMRAECDAILIGSGTLKTDDPSLSCRLSGLESRSPEIFVLSSNGDVACDGKMFSNTKMSVNIVAGQGISDTNRQKISDAGAKLFSAETHEDQVALPELLEDMTARGISSLMVEGGATVAASFLEADLVDEIALFEGPEEVGEGGVASPLTRRSIADNFRLVDQHQFGDDHLFTYLRA